VFRDGREFPPIRTLDRVRHNLPAALTTFVGQTGLIDELHVLLAEHRMITLTGPGGVGKTRVALELGHACVSEYDDGVWLIDLSAVTDPEAVDDMTAAGLGLQEEPDRSLRDTLVDHLRDRRVLIIFDNCEHVIAAAATMADAVVHAGPNVRVVATSREPLGVDGERTVGIEPLPVPDRDDGPLSPDALAQVAAVQLFVDRARLTLSSFTLTDDNTPAVVEICHQLDGIPLALELAAARIKILSPSQILERLDDRFRLLTGGLRTALPRQQTLKALIDWSYDLLDEDEQRLLCDLAVFAGGCTVEAVAAITANDDEFVRAALAARERAGTVVRASSRGELDTLLAGVIATAGARSVEAGRAVPLDVAVGDAVELAGALAARGPRDASYA
jgi:predicted ATPase